MVLVFPDTALIYLLQKVVQPKLTYHLYRNNITPDVNSTLPLFAEAVYSGYAPIDVLASAWTFTQVSAHVGELKALDLFWSNTSPSSFSVYGYYVTDSTGTVLVAAAKFDNAPVVVPVGKYVQVTPMLGSFSGLSC